MAVSSTSSTSSTYTDASYSSKGLSSVISGLDTESLVKSMLSGIQTKIDKQDQEKQTLLWKQEIYRSVISDVNSFQDKYFSLTSNTCLRSDTLFSSMKASSSSSAVAVKAGLESEAGNISMQVAQLATAASLKSSKVSAGTIELNPSTADFSRKVSFTVGEDSIEVDLADLTSADDIASSINTALSGKGIAATVQDGKISLSGSESFKLSGSSTGLKMLGMSKIATSISSDGGTSYDLSTGAVDADAVGTSTVSVSLDGVAKSFDMTEGDTVSAFAAKVNNAFGSSISFTDNGDGTWSVSAGKGQTVAISGNSDGLSALGLSSNTSSQISTTSAISGLNFNTELQALGTGEKYKFAINGINFEFDGSATISAIMNEVNNSAAGVKMAYNRLGDTFSLTSKSTGEGYDITMSDTNGNLLGSLFGTTSKTQGQNAVVNIDGVTVERTSNTFTYNSTIFALKSTTGSYATDVNGDYLTNADGTIKLASGATETKAAIDTTKNTEKAASAIKSFVEDYNSLIEKLNGYIHAKAEYKSYPPLTDDQKKEMTDKEIELWEEKSKSGLLNNDSEVSSFLQDMRTAMYSNVGSKYTLSTIGINSSANWQDYGKLTIDEDKLSSFLENDIDGVKELFNGKNGLSTRLNDIVKKTSNTSSASPGSLVSLAGVAGKMTEKKNTINDRLDNIAEKIEKLKERYEMQKTRYWDQFNAMETALSSMNSQSSYLSQMFG